MVQAHHAQAGLFFRLTTFSPSKKNFCNDYVQQKTLETNTHSHPQQSNPCKNLARNSVQWS
jgi:hypothetical protein